MVFSLRIELGNEAMQSSLDVSVAVRQSLARAGDGSELTAGASGIVRDLNGNTVGRWQVSAS